MTHSTTEKQSKILGVFLDSHIDNAELLSQAITIVRREGCPWFVIYVEDDHYELDSLSRERLKLSIDQAKELGAQVVHLPSDDRIKSLIDTTNSNQINHLVIGDKKRSFFQSIFKTNIATKLSKIETPFKLQVVTLETQAETASTSPTNSWWGYFVSVLLIIVLTGLIDFIQESLPEYRFNASIYNVSMVYLLAIVFSALRYGVWPAIIAAFMSFALYNYLFILPFYEFGLDQFSDVLNFFLFLSASLVSVGFVDAYKRQFSVLRERELAARALQDLTKVASDFSDSNRSIHGMGLNLQEILQAKVTIFLYKDKLNSVFPESARDDTESAQIAYDKQTILHEETWTYYPISTPRRKIGVLSVAANSDFRSEKLIEALAYQIGLAVERHELMLESQDIKLQHQRESLRSSLLSSVSHDLKTPLVSIIGSLSSIRYMDHSLTSDERKELISTAIEEAERLNQSISNILHMTKIEAGDMKVNKQWLGVHTLFSESVARLATYLGNRNIIIPSSNLAINVDPVLFPQVLQNILENIIKYTAADAEVRLEAKQQAETVELRVIDNGPGIPEMEHERLFDKFTRLESRDSRIAGTGLGLSICKAIVELNGGQIILENNVDSSGLSVIITLSDYKQIEEID
jgi:two-component system sensor histidine kinase KdpD